MCKNKKTPSAQVQKNESPERNPEECYNDLKYYNITGHKWALFGWIVGIGILCIFIFAFFSGGIEWIFRIMGIWKTTGCDESYLNLSILPDFLGGMIGILVGFFLDWFIFDKFRCLVKYEAILSVLNVELNDIIDSLMQRDQLDLIVMRDILESEENSVVLYNLPHYCLFNKKNSRHIFSELRSIYNSLRQYTDAKGCDSESLIKKTIDESKEHICYFKKLTDSTYQNIDYNSAQKKILQDAYDQRRNAI